jgi:glycosyltransferase involved in cell wall biosynthesis
VSVVIPTRDCASYLELCLEALRNQPLDVHRWEIVVGDHGSRDETHRLLGQLTADAGLPVRAMRLERGQPRGAVLNVLTRSATGHIIVFLSDDQVVSGDFLVRHIIGHLQGACVLIGSGQLEILTHVVPPGEPAQTGFAPVPVVSDRGDPESSRGAAVRRRTDEGPMPQLFLRKKAAVPHPWAYFNTRNVSVERDVLLQHEGFDERLEDAALQDADLAYRLYSAGVPFRFDVRACATTQVRPRLSRDPATVRRDLCYTFAKHPRLSTRERGILAWS